MPEVPSSLRAGCPVGETGRGGGFVFESSSGDHFDEASAFWTPSPGPTSNGTGWVVDLYKAQSGSVTGPAVVRCAPIG
ncbi:MAG: hypothetical protein ACRD0U_02125 [Acidimicrobiales bacterium]